MRCINNANLHCPNGWEERAAAAHGEAGIDLASINQRSGIWRELKDALAEVSHDKCWYCEVKQIRSDNAVDHFRPKSVYPWLAFEKTNFRYSCTYCNSRRKNPETGDTGGKGDAFPLFNEGQRATAPGQEAIEDPVFLDPCRAQDPGLLDFYDDGRPCARHLGHKIRKIRAETTIKAYHLDHPGLIEKRKVLAAEIKANIVKADGLFDLCDAGNPAIDNAFDGLVAALNRAISETAELSAFARKIVAGSRDKIWVEELLRTA
jgi:uncharacterized protein (TIGR02646 family)